MGVSNPCFKPTLFIYVTRFLLHGLSLHDLPFFIVFTYVTMFFFLRDHVFMLRDMVLYIFYIKSGAEVLSIRWVFLYIYICFLSALDSMQGLIWKNEAEVRPLQVQHAQLAHLRPRGSA